MSVNVALPDIQVVYLLRYLFEELNSCAVLSKYVNTTPSIVHSTLARPFVTVGRYAEGKATVHKIHAQGLPYLAMWRDGGTRQRSHVNQPETVSDLNLAWMCRVPQSADGYDGQTWAGSWATNVWTRACELLESRTAYSTFELAGIDDCVPGKWDIVHAINAGLLGITGKIRVTHRHPPYPLEEPEELKQITATINLYGAGVDLGYDMDLVNDDLQ